MKTTSWLRFFAAQAVFRGGLENAASSICGKLKPMTESETSIRESLLSTLSFLASETKQQEFASKVFYQDYLGEFACWWFDTFYPDEPSTATMFEPNHVTALLSFSNEFERSIDALDSDGLTMPQLQSTVEWQNVVQAAKDAIASLKIS